MESTDMLGKWWMTTLRGALAIIFGIIILVWPGATTLVLVIFFGAFVLVDGLFAIGQSIALMTRKEKWGWMLFKGILGLLIGIIVLARPGVAVVALLYVIAVWLIVTGFIELIGAFDTDMPGIQKGLLIAAGILSIIIGVLLMLMPGSGIVAVIVFIGIYAIIAGILRIILSFMMRKAGDNQSTVAVA